MSKEMETGRNTQSVIAKLMGFGEMPPQQHQQPVYRHQRVLSENYLQKAHSIGKRSSKDRQYSLLISKKKANLATIDSNNDVPLPYLKKRSSSDGMQGMKLAGVFESKNNGDKGKSDKGVNKKNDLLQARPPIKNVVLKPNIGNVQHTSRPSFLLDSRTTSAWEVKKQLLERIKQTKVYQEVQSGHRSRTLGEMLSLPTPESKSISDLGSPISSNEGWKDESVYKLPIFTRLSFSSDPSTKFKKMTRSDVKSGFRKWENNMTTNFENCPLDSGSSSPIYVSSVANVGTKDVDLSHCDVQDKQQPELIACNYSAKEHFLDLSSKQDSPIISHEDTLISANCIEIDEFSKNMGEAYQPCPDSVLEPPFKEDDSSSSEHCESLGTNLHGLRMQLESLKSESEEIHFGSQMVISSENIKSIRCIGAKESREFSYLVDVLEESGFQGDNVGVSFERWMSSPLVFETLEKKYGKQESWNKAERKLLFDLINVGVTEILRPFIDIHIYSRPLRRKMGTLLRKDDVEQELWTLLRSQEKEVDNDLAEKDMGKDLWLDLVDEVHSIVREIEFFLFDELAAELVCV